MKKRIKVLVTAGPTQVRLDQVRVISNIATGRTGIFIAKELSKYFCVTLLLGKTDFRVFQKKDLIVKRFVYFEELRRLLQDELKNKRYEAVVHNAAVSDFLPLYKQTGKIDSGRKELSIKLKPAPKLIKDIRRIDKDIFLAQFKLEVNKSQAGLIAKGQKSLRENRPDLVIVNDLRDVKQNSYKALAMDKDKNKVKIGSRKELAFLLKKKIEKLVR